MPSFVEFITVFSIALFIVQKLWNDYAWNKKYKLPPIIPGIPIFGNLFQIPATKQGPWATELAAKYGEMCVWSASRWLYFLMILPQ